MRFCALHDARVTTVNEMESFRTIYMWELSVQYLRYAKHRSLHACLLTGTTVTQTTGEYNRANSERDRAQQPSPYNGHRTPKSLGRNNITGRSVAVVTSRISATRHKPMCWRFSYNKSGTVGSDHLPATTKGRNTVAGDKLPQSCNAH